MEKLHSVSEDNSEVERDTRKGKSNSELWWGASWINLNRNRIPLLPSSIIIFLCLQIPVTTELPSWLPIFFLDSPLLLSQAKTRRPGRADELRLKTMAVIRWWDLPDWAAALGLNHEYYTEKILGLAAVLGSTRGISRIIFRLTIRIKGGSFGGMTLLDLSF